mmetsp:Transcript_30685/g.41543  ORF Transcript_30685/g.41543 Transcript_30685/m.41543 type:complete len:105 (-) Transcript_30685:185-499(-)
MHKKGGARVSLIRYGDITPQSQIEYASCVVLMLVSAFVWAFVIGTLTTIISNYHPHDTEHRKHMNDMNSMLLRKEVSSDLTRRIRQFMRLNGETNISTFELCVC